MPSITSQSGFMLASPCDELLIISAQHKFSVQMEIFPNILYYINTTLDGRECDAESKSPKNRLTFQIKVGRKV